jgi:hypothetical protein
MSVFYNKYIKYKKKYIELKNKLNTDIFKGGDLIKTELDPSKVSDEFFILDYHGGLRNTEFKIPDNIILILSDCCGAGNWASTLVWYDPFVTQEYNPDLKTLTKDDFIKKIVDGKIDIGDQKYIVLKPGSTICEISLQNRQHDPIVGQHIKKFGDTRFYDTKMELDSKDSFDKNIKIMNDYIETILKRNETFEESILKESKYYESDSFKFFRESDDIQNILYNFPYNLTSIYDFDNISKFIKNVTYDNIMTWRAERESNLNKFNDVALLLRRTDLYIGKEYDDLTKLTNIDILLFILFNALIKKNLEEPLLSDKLRTLSIHNPTQSKVVILYSCLCGDDIDKCYNLFHGISPNKEFISNFIRKIDSKDKKPGVTFTRIENKEPYIYYNDNSTIGTIDTLKTKMRGIDNIINNLSDDDLVIFINLFYDIMNNTGSRVEEYEDSEIYHIGKLINPTTGIIISIQTIKELYGKKHLINNMIVERLIQDNPSYFNSFMKKFQEFMKLVKNIVNQYKKPNLLTVDEFHTTFTNYISNYYHVLYEELLYKYKNGSNKITFPNDINNEYQLKKLFRNISFETEDKKNRFCDYYQVKENWPDNLKAILKNFNIFIESAYRPSHDILAFNNLEILVNKQKILDLKLEYIIYLIGQYVCTELLNESTVKTTVITPVDDNSAW